MNRLRLSHVILGCALLAAGSAVARQSGSGYHLLKKYSLPAAEGSTGEYFDYIYVDAPSRRVYLSHGTEVKVIGADDGALAGNITGLKRDHGIAIASEFGKGFITDGATGKVTIFDPKTLQVTGDVQAKPDADGVIYDPASKRVFVMSGETKTATVIDAKTGTVVKSVDLGGAPEFAVADGKGTIFINLEDMAETVALDAQSLTVKSRWPVAPAGGPTAIAMDRAHRRLFVAGRNPQMLVVLDADTGKAIQSFPITAGADADAYDPETGLVFVSTREGMLHIFHEDSPDKFSSVDQVKTEYGAKTLGLDTKTHNVFVDTADFGPPPAPTPQRPHPQPASVAGTFRVLVYGR
jgi:DNA-binding beta-propeller fold protein YncE